MKQFDAEKLEQVGPSVSMSPAGDPLERRYPAYIVLDLHEDTIAWAIALEGRSEPEYRGEIANRTRTSTS